MRWDWNRISLVLVVLMIGGLWAVDKIWPQLQQRYEQKRHREFQASREAEDKCRKDFADFDEEVMEKCVEYRMLEYHKMEKIDEEVEEELRRERK